MNTLVLFTFLTIGTCGCLAETNFHWMEPSSIRTMCMVESKVEQREIDKVRVWDFSSKDPKIKKYVYCVYHRLKMMDHDGNISVEISLFLLSPKTDPKKFKSAVKACKNQKGANTYEKAFNVLKCYNEKYPKDITAL